jgi:hypothetical protein
MATPCFDANPLTIGEKKKVMERHEAWLFYPGNEETRTIPVISVGQTIHQTNGVGAETHEVYGNGDGCKSQLTVYTSGDSWHELNAARFLHRREAANPVVETTRMALNLHIRLLVITRSVRVEGKHEQQSWDEFHRALESQLYMGFTWHQSVLETAAFLVLPAYIELTIA